VPHPGSSGFFIPKMIASCIELLVHLPDKRKDLVPSHLLDSAGDKMLREELPGHAHLVQEVFDVLAHRTLIFLIGLGEHQAKGNIPFPQPLQKFKVYLLGTMPGVDKHEHRDKVLSLTQVILDHLLPSPSLRLRDLSKAIAGQVHDIPLIVDIKMVDQLRLSRSTGSFGQLVVAGQHVDEG